MDSVLVTENIVTWIMDVLTINLINVLMEAVNHPLTLVKKTLNVITVKFYALMEAVISIKKVVPIKLDVSEKLLINVLVDNVLILTLLVVK